MYPAPVSLPATLVIPDTEIAAAARDAGFHDEYLVTAVAVALAESRGNIYAWGDRTIGGSFGLWQIFCMAHPYLINPTDPNASQWWEPLVNAQMAYTLSGGKVFTPWSVYKNDTYQGYLPRAQAAVEELRRISMTSLDLALLPSCQLNIAAGDPLGAATPGYTYEQDIQLIVTQAACAEFIRQGHNAKVFYIRGAGAKTTDELAIMNDQARAWLKTQPGYSHTISFHSNSGSGTLYTLPLVRFSRETTWAYRWAVEAGMRMGMTPRAAQVRLSDLMYMQDFQYLPDKRVLLMEIGEHQTARSAAYITQFAQYDGIQAARSYLVACGYPLKDDGPVPVGVPVPPGTAFDKYRPVPPDEEGTDMFKVGDLRKEAVARLQLLLVRLGYDLGTYRSIIDPTKYDGTDGDYGTKTLAAVTRFQTDNQVQTTNVGLADDVTLLALGSVFASRLLVAAGQVVTLEVTVASEEAKIVALEQSIVAKQAQIVALQQSIGEKEAQVLVLQATVADYQAQIGLLERSIADLQAQIAALEQTIVADRAAFGQIADIAGARR